MQLSWLWARAAGGVGVARHVPPSGRLAGGGGQAGRVSCGDGDSDGHWPGTPLLPGGGHSEECGGSREETEPPPEALAGCSRSAANPLEGHGPGMRPPGHQGLGVTVEARPLSFDVFAGTQTSGRAGVAWSSDGASELGLHRPPLAGTGAGTEVQALLSSLPQGEGVAILHGGL